MDLESGDVLQDPGAAGDFGKNPQFIPYHTIIEDREEPVATEPEPIAAKPELVSIKQEPVAAQTRTGIY